MQRPACRHENPAQAKFCLECGARLVVACSNCGTKPPASAKFYLGCGHRVVPSADAMASYVSPEAYSPKHLARAAAMYREMGMTYWSEKLEKGQESSDSGE